MIRRPPRSTRTDTLFPYTTLFRSLTALGQDVEMEFRRMLAVLRNVRQHSDNWALGRHRVLDIAVAPTVGPNAFTSFFLSALEQIPSVGLKIHALQSTEDTAEVLSGKYPACILPSSEEHTSELQ